MHLPIEKKLHHAQEVIDFENTHNARKYLKNILAKTYKEELLAIYYDLKKQTKIYSYNTKAVGDRSVKEAILNLLSSLNCQDIAKFCYEEFRQADNMTDEFAALRSLCLMESPLRDDALKEFYNKWNKDNLVMLQWMSLQASIPFEGTIQRVKKLTEHPFYDRSVPNIVRSLQGEFTKNYICFHQRNGEGYAFIADSIMGIDEFNPSMSSSLCGSFLVYRRLMPENQKILSSYLEKIHKMKNISKNLFEIVDKILQ